VRRFSSFDSYEYWRDEWLAGPVRENIVEEEVQLANDADSIAARAVDRDDRFDGYLPGVGEEADAWLDSGRRPSSRRRIGESLVDRRCVDRRPLWLTALVAGLIGGALQPYLFKDLRYR
jgi:hypothetical protein